MKLDTRDPKERDILVAQKTAHVGTVTVGITWVDGRLVFKLERKWSKMYVGVCHFADKVWAVTPIDYIYPTLVTSMQVSLIDNYCEKAHCCLNFGCKLNRFNKGLFLNEFKDMGSFTLGMPNDIGSHPLWFNSGKWEHFWGKLTQHMKPEGGMMRFDESKMEELYKI